MRVLAIDPGERVGWAWGNIQHHADDCGGCEELRGGKHDQRLYLGDFGINSYKDFALKLHKAAGNYDVIVYETWRLSANKAKTFVGNDFPSVQFIGMVRLCAWLAGVKLVHQGPAIKATAEKSMRSMRPDLWEIVEPALKGAHDDGHHGDAILHLWHFYWERYV